MRPRLALLALPLASLGCGHGGSAKSDGGSGPAVGASVLMYHAHINRDGYFQDVALKGITSATLDPTFEPAFTDNVWTSPLYVENGPGGKGTYYVATSSNNVYAFDETAGAAAWPVKNFGLPAHGGGTNTLYPGAPLCGNVTPLGITGTPAIDLATRLMVFDAVTGDGSATNYIKTHSIIGMSIDDGSEKWSVDVSTLKDSTGLAFAPGAQNERAAVLIVNGVAYVAYGGHANDCGDYHGWVVGVPLTGTGAQAWATQVHGAGIWGPGGAASDGTSIYVTTGNGQGEPGNCTTGVPAGAWPDSEAILRLGAGPTFSGQAADYFALNNWFQADCADMDLSGSGPLVIDDPAMTPSALVLGQGKDGYLYLVDRSNLGGVAAAKGTAGVGAIHASSGEISNGSAWATIGGTTYVVLRPNGGDAGVGCPNGTTGDLVAVKLDPTAPQKMTVAWCASSGGLGSPIITSSDGVNDGLVWTFGTVGDKKLHAFKLADGGVAFTSAAVTGASVHPFATIAEVRGRIVVQGDGGLYAFKTQ
jgi:hypothetical protein